MKFNFRKFVAPAALPGKWWAAMIIVLSVIALLLVAAVWGVSHVSRMETLFPHVRVDGLDIGGMSLPAAMEKLRDNGYESIGAQAVTVKLPLDVTLVVRADEVCTETPVADIALMAYDACKGGSAVSNAMTYLRCLRKGMDLESNAALVVDAQAVRAKVDAAAAEVRHALLDSDIKIGEDSIVVTVGARDILFDAESIAEQIVRAFEQRDYDAEITATAKHDFRKPDLDSIYETVYQEKADAYYSDEHEVVAEVVGVSFDRDAVRDAWDAAQYGDEIVIPLIFDQPEMTAEDLEALLFRDCLGKMSTSLTGSTAARINNVTKACESINDVILMPGEEFSYNEALGERTADNGYQLAGAYSDGEVVQEYGGGICQVSSTLYYACLLSNLKITARTCHYFPVGYIAPGMDATVSWGGPEYKFVNDRDYPIRITAYVDRGSNTAAVEIWGTDTVDGKVVMTYETEAVFDTEYEEVQIGYKAQTYRWVYDDAGKLISRQAESRSYYHFHEEDIEWPEESPEVTETPEVTESPEVSETPEVTGSPEVTESPAPTRVPASGSDLPEPTAPVGEEP